MTLDEAKVVGRIAGMADGGCPSCIEALLDELRVAFPGFTWEYDCDTEFGVVVKEVVS